MTWIHIKHWFFKLKVSFKFNKCRKNLCLHNLKENSFLGALLLKMEKRIEKIYSIPCFAGVKTFTYRRSRSCTCAAIFSRFMPVSRKVHKKFEYANIWCSFVSPVIYVTSIQLITYSINICFRLSLTLPKVFLATGKKVLLD